MASLTRRTWVWASSGSWWWTGKPGMLQSMGSQSVRHNYATELNWKFYYTKVLCNQASSLAPDWILSSRDQESQRLSRLSRNLSIPDGFPKCFNHFTFPPAVHKELPWILFLSFFFFFFTIWYYVTFLIVVLICIFLQFMRLNIFHIYWTFVMSSVICLFSWFAHSLKLGPKVDVPSLTNTVPGVRLFLTGCFSKHLHTAEEKAIATHSSTLAWKIPWAEEPRRLHEVHGVTKSQTRLSDFTFTFHLYVLEKEVATHSSVLAWRIPGTGEPGGLPSMGSCRVRHDWSDLAAAHSWSYI